MHCRIVTVLLETTTSCLNTTVFYLTVWHVFMVLFIPLEHMLIRLKDVFITFTSGFHINSMQNGKVSPSCEDSSASRWKV